MFSKLHRVLSTFSSSFSTRSVFGNFSVLRSRLETFRSLAPPVAAGRQALLKTPQLLAQVQHQIHHHPQIHHQLQFQHQSKIHRPTQIHQQPQFHQQVQFHHQGQIHNQAQFQPHNRLCLRQLSLSAPQRCWKERSRQYEERRKVIPKLVYLHNPWKYLVTKLNLLKLQLFWDREFAEKEFIRGSKQAAIVITDFIRTQNTSRIGQFTTPIGFQQITRDMLLSRNDARLKLVQFETEHLRRAIPMKVSTRSKFGRKFCFIDMLFVGLRNTKDFGSTEEIVEINEILRKLDSDLRNPPEVTHVPHRIVFAEIFMRFRKDYSDHGLVDPGLEVVDKDWSVSFYKILSFDVLNYDPK